MAAVEKAEKAQSSSMTQGEKKNRDTLALIISILFVVTIGVLGYRYFSNPANQINTGDIITGSTERAEDSNGENDSLAQYEVHSNGNGENTPEGMDNEENSTGTPNSNGEVAGIVDNSGNQANNPFNSNGNSNRDSEGNNSNEDSDHGHTHDDEEGDHSHDQGSHNQGTRVVFGQGYDTDGNNEHDTGSTAVNSQEQQPVLISEAWQPNNLNQGDVQPGSEYTVQSGDTLWEIAEAAYGDGTQWVKILDANSSSIGYAANGQQSLIYAGQTLVIPN